MAVLAGYVTVLSTGPVTANVRLSQIAGNDATFWFSLLAASGALTAALAFLFFGRLSDRIVRAGGSRRHIFLYAAIALAPIGWFISLANSVELLLILWCLMQLPSAAILSVGTAMALEKLPKKYLPLVSSLFGAGGVLAILYGVVIGTLTRNDTASVLLIGSATAVALALPAAFMKEDVVKTDHLNATTQKLRLPRPFISFLFATASSLAVSAMANDYFYQLSSRIQGLSQAEVASNSQLLFGISAVAFLVSTLSFGILARSAKLHFRVFIGSLVVSAAGLISLALSGDPVALGFGAAVIGIGTGANIAAQFPVLRGLFSNDQELGSQAGIFNMVGVLPSIAVPALGALLVTVSGQNWPMVLGFSIAALALGSALLVAKRVPRGY
jgi:MFS family permease